MIREKQIWEAIVNDDETAFRILYEKYWNKLYYIAYQKTHSVEVAEDLVHDVFLELWNQRSKIEIRSTVGTYISTVLKYKIFRWIERQTVHRKYALNAQYQLTESEDLLNQQLSFDELYNLIEHSMEELPEKCKLIFKLSRQEGQSIQQISQQLNISPYTTLNHIKKALKIIRQQVDKCLIFFILLIN